MTPEHHSLDGAAVSHSAQPGARRGAVGEKYDCEWDYYGEPYLRVRPELQLTDAIKSGWPPANYAQMLRWNDGGAELYSSALGGA